MRPVIYLASVSGSASGVTVAFTRRIQEWFSLSIRFVNDGISELELVTRNDIEFPRQAFLVVSSELFGRDHWFVVDTAITISEKTTIKGHGLKKLLTERFLSTSNLGTEGASLAPREAVMAVIGTQSPIFAAAPSSLEDFIPTTKDHSRRLAVANRERYFEWWTGIGKPLNLLQNGRFTVSKSGYESAYDVIDEAVSLYKTYYRMSEKSQENLTAPYYPRWDVIPEKGTFDVTNRFLIPVYQAAAVSPQLEGVLASPAGYKQIARAPYVNNLYDYAVVSYTNATVQNHGGSYGITTAPTGTTLRIVNPGGWWVPQSTRYKNLFVDATSATRGLVTDTSYPSASDANRTAAAINNRIYNRVLLETSKAVLEKMHPPVASAEVDAALFFNRGIRYDVDFVVGDYVKFDYIPDSDFLLTSVLDFTGSQDRYTSVRISEATFSFSAEVSISLEFCAVVNAAAIPNFVG